MQTAVRLRRAPGLTPRRDETPRRPARRVVVQTWRLPQPSSEEDDPEACLLFLLRTGSVVQIPPRVRTADLRAPIQRILEKYPMPTVEEQGICMAGTFSVAASNGIDLRRRIHFQGFCQSSEALSECIEDVVLDRGGVVVHHCAKDDGLHQRLKMTVAVPYLFGVPPEFENLRSAIELGGGLLERVYGQWYFY